MKQLARSWAVGIWEVMETAELRVRSLPNARSEMDRPPLKL